MFKTLIFLNILIINTLVTADDYKNIDWLEISSLMRKPNWIFDTRRVLNAKMLRKSDINIWQLGEGFTDH